MDRFTGIREFILVETVWAWTNQFELRCELASIQKTLRKSMSSLELCTADVLEIFTGMFWAEVKDSRKRPEARCRKNLLTAYSREN